MACPGEVETRGDRREEMDDELTIIFRFYEFVFVHKKIRTPATFSPDSGTFFGI